MNAFTIRGPLVLVVLTATLLVYLPALAHHAAKPDDPNPSPNATLTQEIGFTKISMSFGRPGVKDRTIWGELVPYNDGDPRPWVAGANGTTSISFDNDVKVDGHPLAAGSYGLHMIPTDGDWTLIFSNDSSRFGIMKYTSEKDALRLTVKPESAPHQEWLKYEIEKTGMYSGRLVMRWEKISVSFLIEVPEKKRSDH